MGDFTRYLQADTASWTQISASDDFKLWMTECEGDAADPQKFTVCLRNECFFKDVPPDVAYRCLTDVRVRRKWDHRIESYEEVDRRQHSVIMYNKLMQLQLPFFAQRDRVIRQWSKKNYPRRGEHISVAKSVTHPDYPEGKDGCVRVNDKLIGYLFAAEPTINGTKLTWIYVSDQKDQGQLSRPLVGQIAADMQRKAYHDLNVAM